MCTTAVWVLLALICFAVILYLSRSTIREIPFCPPCRPLRLFHKLRPAPQPAAFQVKESSSVDERLDRLAEALADKESRYYLSKSKIQSAKEEMAQLGDGPRRQYRGVLDGLRKELGAAELECRRIQQQIEWMAQKRAELNDELQVGHRLYGRAATELASTVADLQQGRPLCRPEPYRRVQDCRCVQ